jgi:YegS/Rv2252/BmrU family lipid kinase
MNITIILNGISRKKRRFYSHILPLIQERFFVHVQETKHSNHAIELAREATDAGADVIFTAGGDGTLNQVLNGILAASTEKFPILGIIPLGSGNDFASMVNASANASSILQLLENKRTRPIDVGRISCSDLNGKPCLKYFINVASLGMGPATVSRVERLPRWLGTGLRYYLSVFHTFLTHPIEEYEVRTETWAWRGKARVVAIANGKSFGNKIYIAPEAAPDDGVFSTFIATDMPLLKFLLTLQKVKNNKLMIDESVKYNTTTQIELSSPLSTRIEAEGEVVGYLPAKIEMLERKINLLVTT